MPPKILRGLGDFLTVHWPKSKKFPHGAISVASRKNICDGTLRTKNVLGLSLLIDAEGVPTQGKVVCQGTNSK